jgi:uncharacterized protein involved in exopolysaccharide biosynthesis
MWQHSLIKPEPILAHSRTKALMLGFVLGLMVGLGIALLLT